MQMTSCKYLGVLLLLVLQLWFSNCQDEETTVEVGEAGQSEQVNLEMQMAMLDEMSTRVEMLERNDCQPGGVINLNRGTSKI